MNVTGLLLSTVESQERWQGPGVVVMLLLAPRVSWMVHHGGVVSIVLWVLSRKK